MVDAETSVSGMMVICYDDMEECKNGCPFTCHAVDHCNDSQHPMIACPPDLGATSCIIDSTAIVNNVKVMMAYPELVE
ncbi:hypothetical protein Tcan_14011 [Toxocara canis]|uniref:Uncharacterized protein n=2 Tax=Toxocara canis TaxID=6265 RepID=A0A0B2VXH7_TOXCA|nr:hypothetical protein Tcan_14011 [Toxocara canis]VDM45271.1 unnamed protein product [Toxocara canis]